MFFVPPSVKPTHLYLFKVEVCASGHDSECLRVVQCGPYFIRVSGICREERQPDVGRLHVRTPLSEIGIQLQTVESPSSFKQQAHLTYGQPRHHPFPTKCSASATWPANSSASSSVPRGHPHRLVHPPQPPTKPSTPLNPSKKRRFRGTNQRTSTLCE